MSFRALAPATFAFLSNFGFRCVEQGDTRVRYEAGGVFIDVYKGRLSHVVNVDFGLVESRDSAKDMLQLLDFLGVTARAEYQHLKPTPSERDLELRLVELAGLLNVYGKAILDKDKQFINEIVMSEAVKNMTRFRDASLTQAQLFAKSFWRKKEFYRVVFFLKPYLSSLSPDWKEIYLQSLAQLRPEERLSDAWK